MEYIGKVYIYIKTQGHTRVEEKLDVIVMDKYMKFIFILMHRLGEKDNALKYDARATQRQIANTFANL